MNVRNLTGSIVALVTPFDADGGIDFDTLGRLVDFHLASHTDAILALGTTGESSPMTHEEDDSIVEFVVDRVAGRIPVIAGAGSNSTETQIMKARGFQRLGADAVLAITPYYNKSNEQGIYRHFAMTADALDIPVILYNIPGRTGCSISVPNVERLAAHPNVMGMKEASGSMSYVMNVAHCVSDDFRLYSVGRRPARARARHVRGVSGRRRRARTPHPGGGDPADQRPVRRGQPDSREGGPRADGPHPAGELPHAALSDRRRRQGAPPRRHEGSWSS